MATDRIAPEGQGHERTDPVEAEGPGPTIDGRRRLDLTWIIALVALAVVVLLVLVLS